MNKLIPILLCCLYIMSGTFIACTPNDVTPPDSTSKSFLRLSTVYMDNKLFMKLSYDASNRISVVNEYDITDSAHSRQIYKTVYHYNANGQVDRELKTDLDDNSVQLDINITYTHDNMFLTARDGSKYHYDIIVPDRTSRTGDLDTIKYEQVATINYALYTLQGNDLITFFTEDYFRNAYFSYDHHYTEEYTYDSVMNPLWPVIEKNHYIRRTGNLQPTFRRTLPTAYFISEHYPARVSITNANISLWLPKGVTFEYKFYPGTTYPTEQKWINRETRNLYATYRYEYQQVP